MLKPVSREVLAFVFPASNTYFRELGLSGKGQVLWDSGKTVGRTGDCWQSNCWRLYEACVFPVSARPFTMLMRSGQAYLYLDFWICLDLYYLCMVVVSGICSAKLCVGCQLDANSSICVCGVYLELLESETSAKQAGLRYFCSRVIKGAGQSLNWKVLSWKLHGKHLILGCSRSQRGGPPVMTEAYQGPGDLQLGPSTGVCKLELTNTCSGLNCAKGWRRQAVVEIHLYFSPFWIYCFLARLGSPRRHVSGRGSGTWLWKESFEYIWKVSRAWEMRENRSAILCK